MAGSSLGSGKGTVSGAAQQVMGWSGLQGQLALAGSLVGSWGSAGIGGSPGRPQTCYSSTPAAGNSWDLHQSLKAGPASSGTSCHRLFRPLQGLAEPGGQRSEEACRSNFEAVLLP